jgi:hypothetical protein
MEIGIVEKGECVQVFHLGSKELGYSGSFFSIRYGSKEEKGYF